MAAKLNPTPSATVHQLKPRKAKGAGGQKRKGPSTNRTKPRPGESKPAPKAQPSDADIRRQQQDRLIALHSQHRTVENREAVASEALSEIRGDKKLIRAAIQNAGFPLETYDDANKKLKLKTKRVDLEQQERIRALIFEAFGLPVGPQPELALEGVPEAARPALHWESVGYFDGINGSVSDPGAAGVPPENTQDYMRGYSQAMSRNGSGLKMLKEDPPKAAAAAPPLMVGETAAHAAARDGARQGEQAAANGETADNNAADDGQPDWTGFANDPAEWTDAQREVFFTWFKSLGPDDNVNIVHPGVEIAFDQADTEEHDATLAEQRKADEPAFSED